VVGCRNKKNEVSRTGIEPVTDGFMYTFYSPPLYQLSYHEILY
jgi:hypothetical protein